MKPYRRMVAAVLALAWTAGPQADQGTLSYPRARRDDQLDLVDGLRMRDPYRWMEEPGAERDAWVAAEDSLTAAFLSDGGRLGAIQKRLTRLRITGVVRMVSRAAGRTFFYRTTVAPGQPPAANLYMVEGGDTAATPLLDPGIAPPGQLLDQVPGPEGRYVALAIRVAPGSSWLAWRVLDTRTRRLLPDVVRGGFLGETLRWRRDGRGFFYTRYDLPADSSDVRALRQHHRVAYHRLRSAAAGDRPVYTPPSEAEALAIDLTQDGRYLIVTSRAIGTEGDRVTALDVERDGARPVPLVASGNASFFYVGSEGPILWFRTSRDAPRGRIIAIDLREPDPDRWREVVPQTGALLFGGGAGQAAPRVIGGRFVLPYQDGLKSYLAICTTDGRCEREVPVPPGGLMFSPGGGNPIVGDPDDPEGLFEFRGITDPVAVYRFDVGTGHLERFLHPDLPFNPDEYVTEQVEYPSADGTMVPMSLTRRRDLSRDGRRPVWLYVYGADGFVNNPFYQPNFMAWLQVGGVFAVAHVRGGGAKGREWHLAAVGATKQRSIDDYAAAAEWLVRAGYTAPGRIVLNGLSAGGVLPAAVMVQHPGLAGTVIADYPLLDMVRYHRYSGGAFTDFGSPDDPAVLRALYAYSPYHHIERGHCYPPSLVITSDADDVVPPLHAYKFVAALQHAETCGGPALMKVVWGSGHATYGSARNPPLTTYATQLAFAARVLHLDLSEWLSGAEAP